MIRKYHNITPCRQIHGITRNSNRGISLTRHQEDKQGKATAYPFKMNAKTRKHTKQYTTTKHEQTQNPTNESSNQQLINNGNSPLEQTEAYAAGYTR